MTLRTAACLTLLLSACASAPEDDLSEWRAWAQDVQERRGGGAASGATASAPVVLRATPVVARSGGDGGDAALRGTLSRTRVPAFTVQDEESLRAVGDTLKAMTGLPIVVDARAEDAAVDAGAVFDLNLQNPIRVDQLLDLLAELAGDEVTWTIRHEAVIVTTADRARGELVLAHHDINMLVMGRTDFVAPRLDRLRLLDELEDEDGHSVFGDVGETVRMMEEDDVVTLVQESVAPTTWDDEGVQIFAENGILFVKHTPAVHARVRAFLMALGA